MTVVLMYPHFWHSKVRLEEPKDSAPSFDNSMRCCQHFGQLGRAIADKWAGSIGRNSGMARRADPEDYHIGHEGADRSTSSMPFGQSGDVVKIDQVEELHP